MRYLMMGAILMSAGCDDGGGGGSPGDEAEAAADAWLEIVDDARYGESWDAAAEYFRGAVPKPQWQSQIAGVRGPLGAVESRTVASVQPATELPGAPDGEYVVIQYETRFANKETSIETVTPMRDPDGVFRVSGYYIR